MTANSGGGEAVRRPAGGRKSRRRFVSELPTQGSVDQVFLVTHRQLRPNRNGQLYLQVDLADRSGAVTARMWNAGEEELRRFDDGDYVHVEGTTQLFQGAVQIIATSIERVDPRGVDESEFRLLGPPDLDRLEAELGSLLAGVADPDLSALARAVLEDRPLMEAVRRTPAGVKHHHAYAGGLLDHVVNLMRLADRVAPLYPEVDRDLLLLGVLLHDIGKTEELESRKGFSYTDEGQLLGHVLLGLSLLDRKLDEVARVQGRPVRPEHATRLRHMVASHHGQYEFGAPKLPMTLEAVCLHHLDHLDAQMASVLQLLRHESAVDDGWTQYQAAHGRKFFRGRGGQPCASDI
jgi:3'-5' exoribonuclease